MSTLGHVPCPTFSASVDDLMCGTHAPEVWVQVWREDTVLCELPIVAGSISADRRRIPLMLAEVVVSDGSIEWARMLDPNGLGLNLPQMRHMPFGVCLAIWAGADGETLPIFFGEVVEAAQTGADGTWTLHCEDPTGYLGRNFAGGIRAVPRQIDPAHRRADLAMQWLWAGSGQRGQAQAKGQFALVAGLTYRTLPATYHVGGNGETTASAITSINKSFGTAVAVSPTTDGATLAADPPVMCVPAGHVLGAAPLQIAWGRNIVGWDRNYGRSPNQLLTAETDGSKTTGTVVNLTSGYGVSWFVGTHSVFRTHAKTVDVTPGADYLAAASIRTRTVTVQAIPHAGVWLRRRCDLLLDDPPTPLRMVVEAYTLPLTGGTMTVGLIPEAEDWALEDG